MDLVYGKEKVLFVVALIISLVVWVALIAGTFGIALIYIFFFFIFYLFAHSAFISYLKGTGVKITEEQFPDLHGAVNSCAQKLGMKEVPDAYLIHADGAFNALATRFLGRNFIVLYSDVADALRENPDAINFYIGHELAHIKRKHLTWGPVLSPALLLPLLGAAYSRAREYTCDRHGLAVCGSPASAAQGLAALAAGGKRWSMLNSSVYAAQSKVSGGFWMSFHELIGDYPWLTKRMAAIKALTRKEKPKHPRRSFFAWVFAAFVPRLGVGGGSQSIIFFIAIIGILAAVAVPAYQDYINKAAVSTAYYMGEPIKLDVSEFATRTNTWPSSNADLGLPPLRNNPTVSDIEVGENGVITIVLKKGKLRGKSLVLEPSVREGQIRWRCSSDDVPPKYLPTQCK